MASTPPEGYAVLLWPQEPSELGAISTHPDISSRAIAAVTPRPRFITVIVSQSATKAWGYSSAGKASEWHADNAERCGQPLPDHDRHERNRPSYRLSRRDDNNPPPIARFGPRDGGFVCHVTDGPGPHNRPLGVAVASHLQTAARSQQFVDPGQSRSPFRAGSADRSPAAPTAAPADDAISEPGRRPSSTPGNAVQRRARLYFTGRLVRCP
jgi:hypothetical protein